MIGIGPGIVPCVVNEAPIDVTDILLTAVESDMDAACCAILAVVRNVNVAIIAQA
jgi:hypothetical protein